MSRPSLILFPFALLLAGLSGPLARADDLAPRYQALVDKGLRWLAQQQHREGHWESQNNYITALTGMAGLAMLMEGSTTHHGKYADNLRRAVDWLIDRTQRNGLIGEPNALNGGLGYMHGHGFSLLFLAQLYGEEEDADRRRKLEDILTRAVHFTCLAQTSAGGWGYVSAKDNGNWDEGSVSITQVQALRAARNAGIVVPRQAIDKVHEYLRKCTTAEGGVIYSLASDPNVTGPSRPTITVAAIASMFSTGDYNSPLARKWLSFAQRTVPVDTVGQEQFGHSEYTHYYFAQVIYMLGDDGFDKMVPGVSEHSRLTWSRYKKSIFEFLARTQNADGSWTGTPIGQIYTTSLYLTILQLEKGTLPFYQR
jgi:hypothetical protein